jgi:hypothetical protein
LKGPNYKSFLNGKLRRVTTWVIDRLK